MAALSYPSQLQREEICKAYTQDQQRMRKNNSVGVLNPSLCDFQSKVGPLSRRICTLSKIKDMDVNKSESELEEYSFHCCLQRWLTNSLLDIETELRCDSFGQLDSSDITM